MRGHIYPLNAILITLGRDPLADIVISDPEISRQHARLMETEYGYELQDLGSTNGTFVDGQRLGGEVVLLQPGQQVEMGSGVMVIYQQVPTGEDAPETVSNWQTAAARETAVSEDPAQPTDALPSWATELQQPNNDLVSTPSPIIATAPLASDPPPVATPTATYTATPPATTGNKRRPLLIALAVLLLFLGCCAFTLFMWYIGGDWLFMQLGLLP